MIVIAFGKPGKTMGLRMVVKRGFSCISNNIVLKTNRKRWKQFAHTYKKLILNIWWEK